MNEEKKKLNPIKKNNVIRNLCCKIKDEEENGNTKFASTCLPNKKKQIQRNEKGNEGNAVNKNAKPIRQYFH